MMTAQMRIKEAQGGSKWGFGPKNRPCPSPHISNHRCPLFGRLSNHFKTTKLVEWDNIGICESSQPQIYKTPFVELVLTFDDRVNVDTRSGWSIGKLGESFYDDWCDLARSLAEPVVEDLPPLKNDRQVRPYKT